MFNAAKKLKKIYTTYLFFIMFVRALKNGQVEETVESYAKGKLFSFRKLYVFIVSSLKTYAMHKIYRVLADNSVVLP